MRLVTCAKCGKVFIPAPQHIFRVGNTWYCKWSCYDSREDKGKKGVSRCRK